MQKSTKLILAVVVVFCFSLVSGVQAGWDDPMTQGLTIQYMPNAAYMTSKPIWGITRDGTAWSVSWVDVSNPRFAVYDPGTPGDETDDVVLDKETGLVWAKDANLAMTSGYDVDGLLEWQNAVDYCRNLEIGGRKGWRLPAVEELASLVDMSQSGPPYVPPGVFNNVQFTNYWSSTEHEGDSVNAWVVEMDNGLVHYGDKLHDCPVWPVRAGN